MPDFSSLRPAVQECPSTVVILTVILTGDPQRWYEFQGVLDHLEDRKKSNVTSGPLHRRKSGGTLSEPSSFSPGQTLDFRE